MHAVFVAAFALHVAMNKALAATRLVSGLTRARVRALFLVGTVGLLGCRRAPPSPYESASPETVATWKRTKVPLRSGTSFVISQGAFGRASHAQKGIEYRWDFDVPYGTPVIAVSRGTVLEVREPHQGGGCDARFSEVPSSVLIKHADGTVAQYVHIDSRVSLGQAVNEGDVVAVTAMNGFICTPQLDFLVYRSEHTLYGSPRRESIPLRFEGLPRGLAAEGFSGVVP